MSALAAGLCCPRSSLVPGQPSTFGRASGARTALGVAASSAHRNRVLSHRAALADVLAARDLDLLAGSIRTPGIFPKGIFPVSAVARTGSRSGCLGFRGHD